MPAMTSLPGRIAEKLRSTRQTQGKLTARGGMRPHSRDCHDLWPLSS